MEQTESCLLVPDFLESSDQRAFSGRKILQNNIILNRKSPDDVTNGFLTCIEASNTQETIVAIRVHLPSIKKTAAIAAVPNRETTNGTESEIQYTDQSVVGQLAIPL